MAGGVYRLQTKRERAIDAVSRMDGDNPYVKSLIDDSVLKFRYGEEDIYGFEQYKTFINGCVKATRNDPRYKMYIAHLKENGLNHCTYYPKINDDMATIEMHHGPIFTIWEICSIVVNHLFAEGFEINSCDVADHVLEQHRLNNIQVVMLCKTAHQEFHDGQIFVNLKQSFGKINNFLSTYHKGVRHENTFNIVKYVELSRMHESTDNNILRSFKNINILSDINQNKY